MMTLKQQYENLDDTQIPIEFSKAVKISNYVKMKFMMEASYIKISAYSIKRAMNRCCINDDLKIFKYLMHKQDIVDFNNKGSVLDIIVNACDSNITTHIVAYMFNSKIIKTNFTQEDIEFALEKIGQFESICYLVKKNNIDFNKFIHKNDDAYIKKSVIDGNIEAVLFLVKNYSVDMVPFKDLIIPNSGKNYDEIQQLIEKQEFSAKLEKTLKPFKNKSKKMKI